MNAAPLQAGKYEPLVARCRGAGPVRTAVIYPCSPAALEGACEAARAGLITPVFVGPEVTIRSLAGQHGIELGSWEIISAGSAAESAAKAAELARSGAVALLMKGSLHTDDLMSVLVSREAGLRIGRRFSHSFVMDVPTYPRLLHITDAAVNIFPDLKTKRDIAQNCIDFAHALGVVRPKVAILSAVETVNPDIPSTLDAAALCKMGDRGQITGAILDGPLAFDNAISAEAARIKGVISLVAGEPDILLVPNLETGNALFKQLQYLAGATAAGVVLGARVPVVLTSRADDARTRLLSTAVACASTLREES